MHFLLLALFSYSTIAKVKKLIETLGTADKTVAQAVRVAP